MKSNKKSTANFINILLTSKSLTNTNLSNINVTYKETNNNNRSPNLEAYINNCVSLSSYDINDNLIDSSNGILGYYNNALCLTIGDINLSNILTNLGINYNQINSIILELEGSFSPYYGYIEIYDNNGDYFDTIDCTDGHNPLEIDIKALYEQANDASFILVPITPCSGVTFFDTSNAYLRISYHPLNLSFLSTIGYVNQQLFDKYKEFLPLSVNDYSFKIDKSYALPYIDKSLFFLRGKHLPIDLHLKYVYPHHFDGFNSFSGFPLGYKTNYHCYLYYNSALNQYIYEDKDGFIHIFQLAANSTSLWFDNSGTGLMLEFRDFLPVIFDEDGNYQLFDYLGRLFLVHKSISYTHFAELKIHYLDDTFKISKITDNYERTIDFVYSSSNISIYYRSHLVALLNSIDNELIQIIKYSNNQVVDMLNYGTTSTYVFSNLLSFALSSGEVIAFHFNKYIPNSGLSSSIYQYDSLSQIVTNIKGRTYDFSYEIEDYQIKEITITDNKSIKTTFSKNNDQTVTSGYDYQTKLPFISVKYKNASYLIKEDFPINQSLRLDLTNNVSSNSNQVYSTLMPPNSSYQTVASSSSYLQKNINYMFYVELDPHSGLNNTLTVDLYEEVYQTSGTYLRASLTFKDYEFIHVAPMSKKGNLPSRFYLVISNNSNQTLNIKRANIVPLLGEFNALCSNINYGSSIFYKDEQGHAYLTKGLGVTLLPSINDSSSYQIYDEDYLTNERSFYKKTGSSFNFWANDKKTLVANVSSASIKLNDSLNLIYRGSSIICANNDNESFLANFRNIKGAEDNSFIVNNFSHNSTANYHGFYYEEEVQSSIAGYDSIDFYDFDNHYRLIEESNLEGLYTEYTYDNNGNLITSFSYIDGLTTYNVRKDYSYDNKDNLVWERNFLGDNIVQNWLFYDSDNNLCEETLSNSASLEYVYSSNLETLTTIKFYENTTNYFAQSSTYQYNRLKEQKTDSNIYSYLYNENGEIASISYNNQLLVTFSYSYSNTTDLETIVLSNGYTYYKVYDQLGRLLLNDKLAYVYNSYSLISQINDNTYTNASSKISYSYNYWNQVTNITNYYNGLSTNITYDTYLRINGQTFSYLNNLFYHNTYSYYQKNVLEKEIKTAVINLSNLSTSITINENVDPLSRIVDQSLLINGSGIKKEYAYYNYSYLSGGTTDNIQQVSYQDITNNISSEHLLETYSYDSLGNISQILSLENNISSLKKYTYDYYSRLIREDNQFLNRTFVYSYDNDGNITEKKEYYYHIEDLSSSLHVVTHQYIYDTNYPNRLISYDNESITYDNLGNPLTYRGATLSWERGTLLSSYAKDGTIINISYDGFGLLKGKIKGSSVTSYNFINGLLLFEIRGSNTIAYLYSHSNVVGFICNNEVYYYEKNIQEDVLAIRNINHVVVAKYIYDAWGNHKVLNPNGTENTSSSFIGNINPIRYRSYYYDIDLKMYWLTTRYYDPEVGRFISPDYYSYLDHQKLHGLNLYAYSKNNPVMYYDPSGHFVILALLASLAASALGVKIAADSTYGIINDVIQLVKGDVKLSPDGNPNQIENSSRISTLLFKIIYLCSWQKKGTSPVKGSLVGAIFEWECHNLAYDYYNIKKAFYILLGKDTTEIDKRIKQATSVDFGSSIFSDGHHPEGDIMKVIYTAGLILIWDYWDLIVDYLVGGRS